ncbi:hypothetical protein HanRHA438_Chr09g0388081 [Helianthus annuus]|nr:hypothetical protein HanRHA438_Chr09g0388081 [Helianthus annuus]
MTPCGNLTDRSASCMLIFVGLVVPKPSLLNIDEGMRLMLPQGRLRHYERVIPLLSRES